MNDLSAEDVAEVVSFDADTGLFRWKPRHERFFGSLRDCRKWNSRFAGKPALCTLSSKGYLAGRILGRTVKAHRAAWAVAYGEWPERQIDHINGDRSDNRLSNLRQASNSQNCCNQRPRPGASRFKGVSPYFIRERNTGRWLAKIYKDGREIVLGRFDCEREAAIAYNEAAIRLHGEFAKLNEVA
jgi:hypothetical protein